MFNLSKSYDIFVASRDGKYVILNRKGKEISSLHDYIDDEVCSEKIIYSDGENFGLLDIDGNVFISGYSKIQSFANGKMFLLKEQDGDEYKLINSDGKELCNGVNDVISVRNHFEILQVFQGGKTFYIDPFGNTCYTSEESLYMYDNYMLLRHLRKIYFNSRIEKLDRDNREAFKSIFDEKLKEMDEDFCKRLNESVEERI